MMTTKGSTFGEERDLRRDLISTMGKVCVLVGAVPLTCKRGVTESWRAVWGGKEEKMVVEKRNHSGEKVIFLDVDGVLHSFDCTSAMFCSYQLKLLVEIVNETGAQIVLSSNWRRSREGEMESFSPPPPREKENRKEKEKTSSDIVHSLKKSTPHLPTSLVSGLLQRYFSASMSSSTREISSLFFEPVSICFS